MKKDFSFLLTDNQKITGTIEESELKRMLFIMDDNIDKMPYDIDVDESIDLFNLDDKFIDITSSVLYEGAEIPNNILKLFAVHQLRSLLDESIHNLYNQEEFEGAPSDEFSLPRFYRIQPKTIFLAAESRLEELVLANPNNKNYGKLYEQLTDIVMSNMDISLFSRKLDTATNEFKEKHLQNSLLSVLAGDTHGRSSKALDMALKSATTKEFLDHIEQVIKNNSGSKIYKIEGGEPIFGNRFIIEGSEADLKWKEAVRYNTLISEAEKQGLVLVIDTETGEEKMLQPDFNNPELIDLREEDKIVYKYKRVRPYSDQGLRVEFSEFNNAGDTDKIAILLEGLNITSKELKDTLSDLQDKQEDVVVYKNRSKSLISKLPKDKNISLGNEIK